MNGANRPYALARRLLFLLPAETAHDLTMASLPLLLRSGLLGRLAGTPVSDPITLMGLRFPNRIGMAAGLDKNARHLHALSSLGFGFLEAGTVTPLPQPGNPKPRMFRLTGQRAIINRMGFNNEGLEAFTQRVARLRDSGIPLGPVGLNIGKNAATDISQASSDYLTGLRAVYPLADYVSVNISSPNTANLRSLQQADELNAMLALLAEERDKLANQYGRRVPVVVKVAPDLNADQVSAIASALPAHGIDGVIATNTTVSRDAIGSVPHASEAGGLSGAPVGPLSNQVIAQLRAQLPAGYPIIGVGGVMQPDDVSAKLDAGADLIQLYSGLIFAGPALVGQCARAAKHYFERNTPGDAATLL